MMANAENTSVSIRLAALDREMTQLKNKIQNLKMDIVLLHHPIGGQPTPKDAKEQIAEGMAKLNEMRIEWEKLFDMNEPSMEVVDFVEKPTMIEMDREMTQLKKKFQNLKMDIVLLHYPIGGQPTPKDANKQIAESMQKLNEMRKEWEKLLEKMQKLILERVN